MLSRLFAVTRSSLPSALKSPRIPVGAVPRLGGSTRFESCRLRCPTGLIRLFEKLFAVAKIKLSVAIEIPYHNRLDSTTARRIVDWGLKRAVPIAEEDRQIVVILPWDQVKLSVGVEIAYCVPMRTVRQLVEYWMPESAVPITEEDRLALWKVIVPNA